jgi:mono/diheme cytochrome c family protein
MLALLAALTVGAGCERTRTPQVRQGAALYAAHCVRCHGEGAVGQDPRRPFGGVDPRLGLLAPALDGRGHCWQHPPHELFELIKHGSSLPGSPMPAWGGRLNDADIRALIAYLHSHWPRRIQRQHDLSTL